MYLFYCLSISISFYKLNIVHNNHWNRITLFLNESKPTPKKHLTLPGLFKKSNILQFPFNLFSKKSGSKVERPTLHIIFIIVYLFLFFLNLILIFYLQPLFFFLLRPNANHCEWKTLIIFKITETRA